MENCPWENLGGSPKWIETSAFINEALVFYKRLDNTIIIKLNFKNYLYMCEILHRISKDMNGEKNKINNLCPNYCFFVSSVLI